MESAVATGSRAYRSSHREGQARRTRQRMIAAATTIFLDGGYAAATMRAIAGGAGVSVPTVESTFGTKARVLKAAIDVAIAGDDEPVAALDRPWTEAALAASTAPELLAGKNSPALVLVTHHVEEIMPAFTHALLLRRGRVHAAGPRRQVLTSKIR